MAIDRKAVASLSLSAAALVALVVQEGFTPTAIIPVKGDVPTLGNGSTTHLDGTPVRMGDTTTPVKALQRTLTDINKFEGALKQCVTVPLHQHEYDAWVQFAYNVGSSAFCNSTAVKKLNTGDYKGACMEMDKWVFVKGKRINGLVNRRKIERDLCLGI